MLFPLFSAEDVSASVATGFQQLTIDNEEEQEALPRDDKPAVIIPNHLQVHTSECSHLMFGSFGSGIGSGQASGLNDKLDEPLEAQDDSSFRHPDTNFYGEEEEQLRNAATNEQVSYQIDSSTRNYHSATDSETEAVQHEPPQEEGHQYKFSSSADYRFENSQQLNPPSETNPQMQNLDTYPNVMVKSKHYPALKIHHTIERITEKIFNHLYYFFLMFSSKDIQVRYPTLYSHQAFKMEENLIFTTCLSQQNTTLLLPLHLAVQQIPWPR